MALQESILVATKQKLGLGEDNTPFDAEIVDHINGVFFDLNRLGIGPEEGFMIEDDTTTWDELELDGLNLAVMNALKTFIYLKVRLIFDPPATSYHINMIQDQITELTHTLLTERGLLRWTPPSSSPSLP